MNISEKRKQFEKQRVRMGGYREQERLWEEKMLEIISLCRDRDSNTAMLSEWAVESEV